MAVGPERVPVAGEALAARAWTFFGFGAEAAPGRAILMTAPVLLAVLAGLAVEGGADGFGFGGAAAI